MYFGWRKTFQLYLMLSVDHKLKKPLDCQNGRELRWTTFTAHVLNFKCIFLKISFTHLWQLYLCQFSMDYYHFFTGCVVWAVLCNECISFIPLRQLSWLLWKRATLNKCDFELATLKNYFTHCTIYNHKSVLAEFHCFIVCICQDRFAIK